MLVSFGHQGGHENLPGGITIAINADKFAIRGIVRVWIPKRKTLWGRVAYLRLKRLSFDLTAERTSEAINARGLRGPLVYRQFARAVPAANDPMYRH